MKVELGERMIDYKKDRNVFALIHVASNSQ